MGYGQDILDAGGSLTFLLCGFGGGEKFLGYYYILNSTYTK